MRETHLAILRHHPFVVEFEPRHVERLAALARDARFERGHVIFREGDECSEFYLIVNGLVALEIVAPGHLFRVQTLFAGDELGWSAVLGSSGKQFQARALERTEALCRAAVKDLYAKTAAPAVELATLAIALSGAGGVGTWANLTALSGNWIG